MSIINPNIIYQKGYIQNLGDPKLQIQQVGIDIRIDKLYRLRGIAYIGITDKRFPHFDEVRARVHPDTGEEIFDILPNETYVFDAFETIEVPKNATAIIWRRSTLNRIGMRVTAGLWDPGFHGTLGGLIKSDSIKVVLARGARIAQVFFLDSKAASQYDGTYQGGTSQTGKVGQGEN